MLVNVSTERSGKGVLVSDIQQLGKNGKEAKTRAVMAREKRMVLGRRQG